MSAAHTLKISLFSFFYLSKCIWRALCKSRPSQPLSAPTLDEFYKILYIFLLSIFRCGFFVNSLPENNRTNIEINVNRRRMCRMKFDGHKSTLGWCTFLVHARMASPKRVRGAVAAPLHITSFIPTKLTIFNFLIFFRIHFN